MTSSPELERRKAAAARTADKYINKDGTKPDLLTPRHHRHAIAGRIRARRADLAEEMGTSLKFLDDEYRGAPQGSKGRRRQFRFSLRPDPWPDPVMAPIS